jgi:hypothetical protein
VDLFLKPPLVVACLTPFIPHDDLGWMKDPVTQKTFKSSMLSKGG